MVFGLYERFAEPIYFLAMLAIALKFGKDAWDYFKANKVIPGLLSSLVVLVGLTAFMAEPPAVVPKAKLAPAVTQPLAPAPVPTATPPPAKPAPTPSPLPTPRPKPSR